ncbi:hypothetical protein FB41_1279 [Cutibacterium acnes]|nr:hypothetical protein FB41_1279 [Cutibacterium acnes]
MTSVRPGRVDAAGANGGHLDYVAFFFA